MTDDIFAKIGDIKGESTDAKHKDEIEVLSFSWGVASTPPSGGGAGGGAGKATFQDLTIVHPIDKATPAEYTAGLELAISRGWLKLHESGTFVKLTQSGADMFA